MPQYWCRKCGKDFSKRSNPGKAVLGHLAHCRGVGPLADELRNQGAKTPPVSSWKPAFAQSQEQVLSIPTLQPTLAPPAPDASVQRAFSGSTAELKLDRVLDLLASFDERLRTVEGATANHLEHALGSTEEAGLPDWLKIVAGVVLVGGLTYLILTGISQKEHPEDSSPVMGGRLYRTSSTTSPAADLALTFGKGVASAAGRTLGGPMLKRLIH